MTNFKSLLLFFFAVIINVFCNSASGQFNVEEFLASALSDPEMESLNAQHSFLRDNSFNTQFLREVDVRFRTNNFNATPDDYRLRFGLMNPREKGANKAYYLSYDSHLSVKRDNLFSSVMRSRYELLLNHIYYEQLEKLLREDQRRITEMMDSENILFSFKDLLELDRSKLKLDLRLEKLSGTKSDLEFQIGLQTPFQETISWENFNLITPGTMLAIMESKSDTISPLIVELIKDKNLKRDELVLDKVQSRRNIGFFQTEYDRNRGMEFKDHLGFQVGINLPLTNPDRSEQLYDQIKLMDDEGEIEKEKQELENMLFLLKSDFKNISNRHILLSNKIQSLDNSDLSTLIEYPEVLLKMVEYQSELKEIELVLYEDLLSTFLDILTYQGRIATIPRINYLSNDLNVY